MSKFKKSIKVTAVIAAGLVGVTTISTSALGQMVNAASFTSETHASDDNIIRNMGTKVGYIKNAPDLAPTYMSYPGMDLTGATHVTVRASSGAATGGTLSLRLGRPAGTDLAAVNITPTGSWDTFQDFTVPLSEYEIRTIGSRGFPLYAVVTPGQTSYEYDLESFKFERTSVGTAIEAENFSRERFSSVEDDVRKMGNKVGYIKQSYNWIDYDNVNFVGGSRSVTFRAASGNPLGGTVVIYDGFPANGVELGRVKIASTGSFDTFQDFSANIPFIAGGTKRISLQFLSTDGSQSYLFDLDSFTFNLNPVNNLGMWINAATYDGESAPTNEDIIRDMGNKVGYIKNDINSPAAAGYFIFDNFDIAGAKTVTVRYSSGGTGGVIDINFATHYSGELVNDMALPPTGGWDVIREVTLPIDQYILNSRNGRNLYFAIPRDTTSDYKFDIHAFRFDP